ncbi:MAG: MOSC domain-containing protein [Verrucomicrobia bacterium]|nr:MOSC domain-containing protein [Verrucomicrobiota bacterium]
MPDTCLRMVNSSYATNGEIVSFADAFPVLLIGEASMADLNSRLLDPVPSDRFRLNLVVETSVAYDEDHWGKIAIGSAVLHGTTPCGRCSVPTVDQATGNRTGPGPIQTLASFRRFGQNTFFGRNFNVVASGFIQVGDSVELLTRSAPFYR